MKKKFKCLFSFLIVISVLITSCNKTPENPSDNPNEEKCAYGNYDYSLKAYHMTTQLGNLAVYKNNVYYLRGSLEISYVDLSNLRDNMRGFEIGTANWKGLSPEYSIVCSSTAEDHYHFSGWDSTPPRCPGRVRGALEAFVLDAYESAGSYPVFYYVRATGAWDIADPNDPNNDYVIWEPLSPYGLYRYDTADNSLKELDTFNECPQDMMSYGDYFYMMRLTGDAEYDLYGMKKSTREVYTVDTGSHIYELIDADESGVYVLDQTDGDLYRMSFDLKEKEKIFTLPEVVVTEASDRSLGLFFNNGYIYYRSDFVSQPFPVSEDRTLPIVNYSLSRVPLGDPSAKPQVVAGEIFRGCDFGVTNNTFYFTPADYSVLEEQGGYGKNQLGYYFNFSNGRLCAVDLDTLECRDVIEAGSGLQFDSSAGYQTIWGNCLITYIRPYKESEYYMPPHGEDHYIKLFDLETGDMYFVYDKYKKSEREG